MDVRCHSFKRCNYRARVPEEQMWQNGDNDFCTCTQSLQNFKAWIAFRTDTISRIHDSSVNWLNSDFGSVGDSFGSHISYAWILKTKAQLQLNAPTHSQFRRLQGMKSWSIESLDGSYTWITIIASATQQATAHRRAAFLLDARLWRT